VVSTEALETRLKPAFDRLRIPMGQIEALTGIRERRFFEPGHRVSQGAAEAGRQALEEAQIESSELGALIFAGVCRDEFEPATACHVAASIGVSPQAMIYDLSNACLGVLNGIIDLANRIELGQIRAGMVVSCESAREIVDAMSEQMLQATGERGETVDAGEMERFRLSLATLTGGSGAVAVVVSDGSFEQRRGEGSESTPRRKLLGAVTRNAPAHHMLCRWGVSSTGVNSYAPYMQTDGVGVLTHGVQLGVETFEDFCGELGWSAQSIDRVICHQVGAAHQAQILAALSIDPSKDFSTYPYLGNMGTVALPSAAAIAEGRGVLQGGHKVAFLGIGSGLNCTMMGVAW